MEEVRIVISGDSSVKINLIGCCTLINPATLDLVAQLFHYNSMILISHDNFELIKR